MSAEAASISHTWRVGSFTATMSVPTIRPGQMVCPVIEWSPSTPRELNESEVKQYRAGRDEAFRALGLNAVVIEV